MKLNVIIFCVLLFCSRIVVALPHAEDDPRHGASRPSNWPVHENAPEYHNTDFAQTHENPLLNSGHQNTGAQELYSNQGSKGYESFGYNKNPTYQYGSPSTALGSYGPESDHSFMKRVPNTNSYAKNTYLPSTDEISQIQQISPVSNDEIIYEQKKPSITSMQEPYQSQGSYQTLKSPLSHQQFYQPEQFYHQPLVTGAHRNTFNGNYRPVPAPSGPIPYENRGSLLVPDLRGRNPGNNVYANNFVRPHEFNNPRPYEMYSGAPVISQPQNADSYVHHYRSGHPIPNIDYSEGPSVLQATLTRDFKNHPIGNSYGPRPEALHNVPITQNNGGLPADVLTHISRISDKNDESDLRNPQPSNKDREDNNGPDDLLLENSDKPVSFDASGIDIEPKNPEPIKQDADNAGTLIDINIKHKNNKINTGSSPIQGDDEDSLVPSTLANPDDFDNKEDTQNKPDLSPVLHENRPDHNNQHRQFPGGVDRYDFKDITKDAEMRHPLSPHKQRYKVIFKNGTIQYVDDLESIQQYYPNHKFISKKKVPSVNNLDASDDGKAPDNQDGSPTDENKPLSDNNNLPVPVELDKSSVHSTSDVVDLSSTTQRATTTPKQPTPISSTVSPDLVVSTPPYDNSDSIITLSPIETPADDDSDFKDFLETTEASGKNRKEHKKSPITPSTTEGDQETSNPSATRINRRNRKTTTTTATTVNSIDNEDVDEDKESLASSGRKKIKKSSSSTDDDDTESYDTPAGLIKRKNLKKSSTTTNGYDDEDTELDDTSEKNGQKKFKNTSTTPSGSGNYEDVETSIESAGLSKKKKIKNASSSADDEDSSKTTTKSSDRKKTKKSKDSNQDKESSTTPSSGATDKQQKTTTPGAVDKEVVSTTVSPISSVTSSSKNKKKTDKSKITAALKDKNGSSDDDEDDLNISFNGKDVNKSKACKSKGGASCKKQKKNKQDKESSDDDNDDGKTASKDFQIDLSNIKDTPSIWFRTNDQSFYEKILADDDSPCSVVYFFEMDSQPVVEREINTTIYPDGTIVVETTETTWENKGDPSPKVVKTTKVIPAEDNS